MRNLLLVSAAAAAICTPAAAQPVGAVLLQIPPQPAPQGVAEFARQADTQVLAPADLLAGRRTRAVYGRFAPKDGLARLLAGSGLTVGPEASGVLTLQLAENRLLRRTSQVTTTAVAAPSPTAGPVSAPEARLEEVVVTATRREESLQSVPIAVTAIGGEQLQRAQITSVAALQFAAPSLNLQAATGDRSAISASIRGLYLSDSLVTLDPAVGVYLDGVYLARTPGLNQALVDIQRVEVLRGPQGTLFGRNTIGGAINIVPNTPTDSFGGELHGGAGNHGQWRVRAILNVPFTEGISARLAYQHAENNGFGRNLRLNTPLSDDSSDFVRLSLRASAGPFTALITADRAELNGGPQMSRIFFSKPCGPTGVAACLPGLTGNPNDLLSSYTTYPFYDNAGVNDGGFKVVTQGASAVLTYDLGSATAKSLTAIRRLERNIDGVDLDGTPYVILDTILNKEKQHQFSQELQLYGDAMSNRLDWIIGAFYFDESGSDFSLASNLFPFTRNVPNITDGAAINKSVAVYAQASYKILDQLKVTGGVRYTKDQRQLISRNRAGPNAICTLAPALLDTPGVCRSTQPNRKFTYWPWTVGLDWTPAEDLLMYGKVSRGFRAGGYNLRGTSVSSLDPFGPEEATSYELGIKGSFLDRRLRVNAAAFHTDYTDIQLNTLTSSGTLVLSRTQNAGEARIRGGELEVVALPMEGLRLSASGSVTDAKYTKLRPGATATLNDKFFGTPKYTYALAADYTAELSAAELDFHLDWSWRSKVYNSQTSVGVVKAYGILNGSLGVTPAFNQSLQMSIWGRNLLSKKYYARILDFTAGIHGVSIGMPGDPRTYGVTATYSF